MHCSRAEDGAQVFVELGTLIVEGRVPAEDAARGHHEGPHCPSPHPPPTAHAHAHAHAHAPTNTNTHHSCDPTEFLCIRAERLRKHLTLLCSAAVPMCVEVLLCPACPCGAERARSPDIANIPAPSPSDILLEQWTVTLVRTSGGSGGSGGGVPACSMSARGLLQAVRSQLHFSQLSAWWSSSRGARPANVCYRVTLPEQEFASQFSKPPLHHTFPPASVGSDTQIKVSVRTLPRSEILPAVQCTTCAEPQTSVRKRSVGLEQPMMLGESLLDPPGPPGPAINRAHAGLSKWNIASPPSPPPPRRRPSRQNKPALAPLHILPLPGPVDDRMQTNCDLHGKHICCCEEDVEEIPNQKQKHSESTTNKINLEHNEATSNKSHLDHSDNTSNKINLDHSDATSNKINLDHSDATSNKINLDLSKKEMAEVLTVLRTRVEVPESVPAPDKDAAKGDLFLSAILRSSRSPSNKRKLEASAGYAKKLSPPHDGRLSDTSVHTIVDRIRTKPCENSDNANKCQEEFEQYEFVEEFSNLDLNKRVEPVPGGGAGRDVPSALDKAKFRRSLDSAASMVFHWRTGLPLTSSPAPLRRASQRFDFDSSLNSVSAIRSALFDAESGEDTESECSSKSPCSPQIDIPAGRDPWTVHYQCPASALLGSFEESVLNGRLEPVSTVHGFTADLGASGSFCPPHLTLPVTVFFYTLGDNDKVSTPYLAHINLGKKGYTVPRSGTIQVTLLNPLGTVIKMFVVVYDLTDMPANSHTFLRQRTLYMPSAMAEPSDNSQKYLRYLIHLRFASSKSGRVSLHTDIRIIIFRKSDVETAAGHGVDTACELRSFTHGPTNPKFSPRK